MGPGSRLNQGPSPAAQPLRVAEVEERRIDLASLRVATERTISSGRLDRFLDAPTHGDALRELFGDAARDLTVEEAAGLINSAVAQIDRVVGAQLNAILHHPQFQKLEASWRGVEYLTNCVAGENSVSVQLRVLSLTWKEIERDLERAVEFDQSQIFKKVYEEEFGSPGGSPYGLIIGDYEVEPRPREGHPHDDVEVLRQLSGVAAAAFCPMILGSSPGMFGLQRFSELERVGDVGSVFGLKDFVKWRSFRDTPDSKFIGLAAPRILMRGPHQTAAKSGARFPFREAVGGPTPDRYLWGNAAYAFGEVVIRAYAESGWLADIRGVRRGIEGGGIVTRLPRADFGTDRQGVAVRPPVDASFAEEEEAELHQLGFMSLTPCKGTPYAAFYGTPSTHKPATYSSAEATQSARFSAMLHYTLCVSRFAHYLKVIARDKVGSFDSPGGLQMHLHQWLMNYVTPGVDVPAHIRARMPLRSAEVEVQPDPGKPGAYHCVLRLAPHYQLDELAASLRLDTSLRASQNS